MSKKPPTTVTPSNSVTQVPCGFLRKTAKIRPGRNVNNHYEEAAFPIKTQKFPDGSSASS